jgi:mono/diheme cytochrome c family protein
VRPHATNHSTGLAALAGLALAALVIAGCSDSATSDSPSAQRGKQIYVASCTACHNQNPALPGALGPDVKGASRELLEAKVVHGRYPQGYTPKRPTAIMQPQPALAQDIAALADFLKR